MLERATAFLAQTAAIGFVLIGLIAILSFTHSRAYRAGYCATETCEADAAGDWWVFGEGASDEARPLTSADSQVVVAGPPIGAASRDRRDYQPDPPPPVGPTARGLQGPDRPVYDERYDERYDGRHDQRYGERNRYAGPSGTPSGQVTVRHSPGGYPPGGYPSRPGYGIMPGEQICSPDGYDMNESDIARCWLRVGDAYQAVNRVDQARQAWDEALFIGSSSGGTQSSLIAHQRMQGAVLERSCPTSQRSLERIAYGFSQNADDGDIIALTDRQRALASMGYYTGEIDGSYGPVTRRSVRDFQSDMGYDQTGALTAQETVMLVCHAALTARDAHSQNLLGIMFATGLGVEQSIDTALEWLETAANRDHGGANFNLALIYGTGTVQGSYRLCGIVESPERADAYLRRAAETGHHRAGELRRFIGTRGDRGDHWGDLALQLLEEAERTSDRFYLAWQRRVEEIRTSHGQESAQPGCYQAAFDPRNPAYGGGN